MMDTFPLACFKEQSFLLVPVLWHWQTLPEEVSIDNIYGHLNVPCTEHTLLLLSHDNTDMVAVNGESSGHCALKRMHQKMLNDSEGQHILL